MNYLARNTLLSIIDEIKQKKILVIGDLMLDQYIWGSVNRISPEGPIPVLNVNKEEFRLGGAANVAVNIRHLNCDVYPVGLIGKDQAGEKTINILESLDIPVEGIVQDADFQTIVKQRAITSQQQLLRIDYESKTDLSQKIKKELLEKVSDIIQKVDGVVISDYAKGVLDDELVSKAISLSHKKGIPVICDPGKGVNYKIYQGITSIKPNRFEAEQTVGFKLLDQSSILKAAKKLKEICQSTYITISLDKDGILFFSDEQEYQFLESEVPEVFDVTGAGDTLISTMIVLLSNNAFPLQATYISNLAAGLETSHLGVVPVPWSEIRKRINNDGLSSKITTLNELLNSQKENGDSPLIFTNGYFDNISAGHLKFLLEINKLHGKLVVAINSDECIKRQKGAYPILEQHDRARLLASMENVKHVIIFDSDDASELIRTLKPRIVVKGIQFKNEQIPELNAIKQVGATIEYIPHFS